MAAIGNFSGANTINDALGSATGFHSALMSFGTALQSGNSNEILSATGSLIVAANSMGGLLGIGGDASKGAALITNAANLGYNLDKLNQQVINNQPMKWTDLQNVIGDTFSLAGDFTSLVFKGVGGEAIGLELNLIGMGIKAGGEMAFGNDEVMPGTFFDPYYAGGFFGELATRGMFSGPIGGTIWENLFGDNKWHQFWDNLWRDWNGLNRDGKYHVYDPIVLDLDGDGIEAVAGAQFNGSLFDHDKDGIRTSTGWIKSDDGILVIDRNQDGLINNGGELFGDSVTLKDGTQAKHGYAALAEFDSNSDGKVDSNDIDFNKLQVWRDLNQDGISQKDELFSLVDTGVKALNLTYKDTNTSLAGGNVLAQTGTYEKADGSIAQMGDVNFAFDSVYSEYIEKIELTDEQKQVANLKGIGRVRDLQEAAALSSELASTLKEYSSATSKEQQLSLLDKLVLEWAKTDPTYGTIDYSNVSLIAANDKTSGSGTAVTPGAILLNTLSLEKQQQFDAARKMVLVLDAFSGTISEYMYYVNEADAQRTIDVVHSTYENLKSSIYNGLLLQTRLKEYTDEIAFSISQEGDFNLDFSLVINKFEQNFAKDNKNAFIDLAELIQINPNQKMSDALQLTYVDFISHGYATGVLMGWIESLNDLNNAKSGIKFVDAANKALVGTALNDTLIGNELNNNLNAGAGNDFILAGAGDDVISGGDGNDILMGEVGNDTLYGNAGNDTLNGGEGNDYLDGGAGDDTYVFAKGHGQDTIYDTAGNDTVAMVDTIQQDLWFTKSGNNLIISAEVGDSITINNHFYSSSYQVENLKFSDGSNLDVAMVNSLVNSMAAFASQQTSGLTSVELRDKYWAQNIAVGN